MSDPWTRRSGSLFGAQSKSIATVDVDVRSLRRNTEPSAIRPEAEYIDEETRCVLRPFYLDFDRTNLDDRVRLLIGSEGIRW